MLPGKFNFVKNENFLIIFWSFFTTFFNNFSLFFEQITIVFTPYGNFDLKFLSKFANFSPKSRKNRNHFLAIFSVKKKQGFFESQNTAIFFVFAFCKNVSKKKRDARFFAYLTVFGRFWAVFDRFWKFRQNWERVLCISFTWHVFNTKNFHNFQSFEKNRDLRLSKISNSLKTFWAPPHAQMRASALRRFHSIKRPLWFRTLSAPCPALRGWASRAQKGPKIGPRTYIECFRYFCIFCKKIYKNLRKNHEKTRFSKSKIWQI